MNKMNITKHYKIKIVTAVLTVLILNASCIRKVDLSKHDKEDPTDTPDQEFYMYPFNKEVENATSSIIIRTNRQIDNSRLQTEIPMLKYNKTWLFMWTQDDCRQAAFCRTWAAINGKPISSSTPIPTNPKDPNQKHALYYHIRHLLKGDLPPNIIPAGRSLGYTDGAGNEVRFAITTTLAPEWKWMDEKTDVSPGFTDNYSRFYEKSGLVWDDVKMMLNYGTGIAFHDGQATDVNNPTEIISHYQTSQGIITTKLSGRACKTLSEPNGNKTYVEAAYQYPDIQTMTAQTGTVVLYPFQVYDDLQQTLLNREMDKTPQYFKQQIETELRLPQEKRKAIYIGMHNTDNSWVDFLNWLNDNYGKDGDDSMWFPSQEEYYEYNFYRIHGSTHIEQIDDNTFKLTVNLPSGKYFYHPATTVNIAGLNTEDIESVEGDDVVTGLSYKNYGDGIMMNIDCRKYLAKHAEYFVEQYEKNKSNSSNKADAIYFVNLLKESALKADLLKRIK